MSLSSVAHPAAVGVLVWLALAAPAAPAAAQPDQDTAPAAAQDVDPEPAGDLENVAGEAEDDLWGFEDDEEVVETWGALLRDQASDLVAFTAFAVLAMVSFLRKSVWLKYVTFVAAIGYLGFAKSQLISVVNIYGVFTGNMPVFKYSMAWYLFAGFTVVSTVLWGRVYCGRVCAYGALTQLLDRFVPARLRFDVPARIEKRAALIKYGLLAATLGYFLITTNIAAYRFVEPFWMFTRRGSTGMWIGLAVLLLATVFVRNLYCRFLCPVGAALGLLSKLTVFKIKRWSECNNCKLCEKACEWGAIRGPEIVMTECVRCDDCERLYHDRSKCPHWLILARAKLRRKQPSASTV